MDVEATRKAMKLSRKELAVKAGVTESAVWSVEHGKNPRGGEEVRQAVLLALDPLAKPAEPASESSPALEPKPAGQSPGGRGGKRLVAMETHRPDWTYRYEWQGVTSGEPIKVNGETGSAKLVHHVTTDAGNTHVTVIMDGKFRSFAPDRVQPIRRGKRKSPGEGTNGITDWKVEVETLAGETHELTFASYADCRAQAKTEVEHGGKVKIINYLGTVVEVQPKGWTDEVGVPKEVTV